MIQWGSKRRRIIIMKWEEFLKGWGTEDQNLFLFAQWCLWVHKAIKEEDSFTLREWCDWNRLEVQTASMRETDGTPVVFYIGEVAVLDLFGFRIINNTSLVTQKPVAFSTDHFTHWVHSGCHLHVLQTFLRKFVNIAKNNTHGEGRMVLLIRILRRCGWLSWRCSSCTELVELIRRDIVEVSEDLGEKDPYQIRTNRVPASNIFSMEEWIRLLLGNGRLEIDDPSVLLERDDVKRVWTQAALTLQEETRKVFQHTTLMNMRDKFIDYLCGIGASTTIQQRRSCSAGQEGWIDAVAPILVKDVQQWLVTHFKFIPFSEIDFGRMVRALLIFCAGFLMENQGKSREKQETVTEDPWSLFCMTMVLLETHDRALCRGFPKEDTKMEFLRDYHPTQRRQTQTVVGVSSLS